MAGRGAARRLGWAADTHEMPGLVDEVTLGQMRSRSQRALFEGLAHTARLSQDRWYILSAHGRWRAMWIFVVELATLLTAVLTPLASCQVVPTGAAMRALEATCDVFFAIDVLLHFFTAYRDERRDIIVTSPAHIRQRYVRSWFALDLVGALPLSALRRNG